MGNRGDIVGSTQRYANTQTYDYKSIQQRMDIEKLREIKVTPAMKEAMNKGEQAARDYFKNQKVWRQNTLLREYLIGSQEYASLDDYREMEFFKKNPKLETAHINLIETYKITWELGVKFLITECHRSPERQLKLFNEKKSQVKFGMHNHLPSLACDWAMLDGKGKVDWNSLEQYAYAIGVAKVVAANVAIRDNWDGHIASGADWKGKGGVIQTISKTTFRDWAHLEYVVREGRGYKKDKKVMEREFYDI